MQKLKPFVKISENIEVLASLKYQSEQLFKFSISLNGSLDKLLLPPPLPPSEQTRRPDLWRETCLEFFSGASTADEAPYIEFNFSPSGDWDLYLFDAYRQGMRPLEADISSQQISAHQWVIEVRLLKPLPWKPQTYQLSTVLKNKTGEISYWAPSHPSEKADFHDKTHWQNF